MITQSIALALGLSAVASASLVPSAAKQFFSYTDTCTYGLETQIAYIADDSARLFMCGSATPVSTGGLNEVITAWLPSHRCGDLTFEVRNVKMSSGIAISLKAGGKYYAAVGDDTPEGFEGVIPIKAYAGWALGDCFNFFPSPNNEAVFVRSLAYEANFPIFGHIYGAYPIGAQDGFVYEQGLQCVVIKDVFCRT